MEKAFQRAALGPFGPAKDAVTRVLLDAWGQDPSHVPSGTHAPARTLIDAINAHFTGCLA